MTEQWRPVVGYEGIYEVSSHGQVRSVDRVVARTDGQSRRLRGKTLKQAVNRKGYMRVDFCRDSVRKPYEVHTIVAAAFLGTRPEGMQVMHLNDDPRDNRAANLAYGTQVDNMRQCANRGRTRAQKQTHCVNGHEFTPENTIPRAGRSDRIGRRCRRCREETIKRYEEKRRAR